VSDFRLWLVSPSAVEVVVVDRGVARGGIGACPPVVGGKFSSQAYFLLLFSSFVYGFWGLRPQTSTGALPLDPAGDFRPPDPLKVCLPYINPGYPLVIDGC